MKIETFVDEQSWLEARRGKVTGSRLKDIHVKRGTKEKIGFYELITERLSVSLEERARLEPIAENPMERGHRLEEYALDRYEQAKRVKLVRDLSIWYREDIPQIAVSPDAHVRPKKGEVAITRAVEAKCLSEARHIQAVLLDEVPDDYEDQVTQYFCVNDDLETVDLVLYQPLLRVCDFHIITVRRADRAELIEEMLEYQRSKLAQVDEIVNRLMQF